MKRNGATTQRRNARQARAINDASMSFVRVVASAPFA